MANSAHPRHDSSLIFLSDIPLKVEVVECNGESGEDVEWVDVAKVLISQEASTIR